MPKLVAVCVDFPARGDWTRVIFHRQHGVFHNLYEEYVGLTQIDAVTKVIGVLSEEVPGFAARFIEADKRRWAGSGHRQRRYVAEQRADLYYPSSRLIGHSRHIAGVWIADNLNACAKLDLIDEACEAAGVPCKRIAELGLVKAAEAKRPTVGLRSTASPRAGAAGLAEPTELGH